MTSLPKERPSRQPFAEQVIVGRDMLELISSAMYVDPLAIFREYVQNATDAIDEAKKAGLYSGGARPRIDITLDLQSRTIKIRDNGTGIPTNCVTRKLSSLGASTKRGNDARGFRGVGRLSGLAYCQELVFRTKTAADELVSEMIWDCRKLKGLFRDHQSGTDLSKDLHDVISLCSFPSKGYPSHFFEVELRQVTRHKNDILLNENEIRRYLAQVGPVPFSPYFPLGKEIQIFLETFNAGECYDIFINGSDAPIVKLFQTDFEAKRGCKNSAARLETFQLPGVNNGADAVGWFLHHDYLGALSDHLGVKGLRVRVGNIQIGDENILQNIFPETRFNAWSIGEVHVLTSKIIPNGRRDDFEQNNHYANLINHITPKAKVIAKVCRHASAERARQRKDAVKEGNGGGFDWGKAKTYFANNINRTIPATEMRHIKALLKRGRVSYAELIHILLGQISTGRTFQ